MTVIESAIPAILLIVGTQAANVATSASQATARILPKQSQGEPTMIVYNFVNQRFSLVYHLDSCDCTVGLLLQIATVFFSSEDTREISLLGSLVWLSNC